MLRYNTYNVKRYVLILKIIKIITLLALVLVLTACVSSKKSVFTGTFEEYNRTVMVYHKDNVVTKEIYETTAPLKYWGYETTKDARESLQDEKQKLKEKYEKLPRGTVKFDFTVNGDDTITQKMVILYDDKKLRALIKEGIVNERAEMSDGKISFNKHKFIFERNGLTLEE